MLLQLGDLALVLFDAGDEAQFAVVVGSDADLALDGLAGRPRQSGGVELEIDLGVGRIARPEGRLLVLGVQGGRQRHLVGQHERRVLAAVLDDLALVVHAHQFNRLLDDLAVLVAGDADDFEDQVERLVGHVLAVDLDGDRELVFRPDARRHTDVHDVDGHLGPILAEGDDEDRNLGVGGIGGSVANGLERAIGTAAVGEHDDALYHLVAFLLDDLQQRFADGSAAEEAQLDFEILVGLELAQQFSGARLVGLPAGRQLVFPVGRQLDAGFAGFTSERVEPALSQCSRVCA